MANLATTKIVDMLPPSLQSDSQVIAAATALDAELTAVTAAIEECLLLPRLDELAEDVIDLLAWQWHVEGYDDALPIAKKRALVLQSIAWHRRKGTPGLVQDLVTAIYSGGVVTEWFQYGGEPYHFRVQTTGVISSESIYTQLQAAINAAKNVRSWLDGVYIVREWSGAMYMGFASHEGKIMTLHPAAFDDQVGSMGLYLRGAVHKGTITTILDSPYFGPPATFTRASVAYNSANQQVAINTPRFETPGIMIEEGTTNLPPAGAENFVTGWGHQAGETVTVTPNQLDPWGGNTAYLLTFSGRETGSGYTRYWNRVLGKVNPHATAVSIWCKYVSGAPKIAADAGSGGIFVPTTGLWTKMEQVRNPDADTDSELYIHDYGITNAFQLYVCQPQVETKSTVTTYTPPGTTRDAESLTVPAMVLSQTVGTAEFAFTPTSDDKSAAKYIFGMGNAANYIYISSHSTTGYFRLLHRYANGTVRAIYSEITAVAGTQKQHKFSYAGSTLTYTIDGVTIGTCQFDGLPALDGLVVYFGARYDGTLQRNGYISNVRISSVARSDAEMAYTGPLRVDLYTTFLRRY